MTELSPEARAILDAGTLAQTPSAATKAEVLLSVESAIAGGPVSSSAGGFSASKLLLLLAVAAGIAAGIYLFARGDDSGGTSSAVAQLEPAKIQTPTAAESSQAITDDTNDTDDTDGTGGTDDTDPPVEPEEPETLPLASPSEGTVTKPSTETRAKRKIKREPSKSVSSVNTLLAERKLLVAAKGAIAEGNHKRARGILGKHKREYPQGILSAERDALRAISLCLDPEGKGGPAAAKRFLLAHAQSPIAPRVKNICKLP